jgi:hypothetical protein
MPGPFVQFGEPPNELHHLPAGATTFDLPAIEVVKGVEIRGRLVDMVDRPIANRRVVGGTEHRRYAFATTDLNGEFTTNSVPPGIKLSYSVSVSDHEPPIDATILKEEPLLLRAPIGPNVAKNEGLGVSGTVVDRDVRPVEGVEVTVFIDEADEALRISGKPQMRQRSQPLTTDSAGRFHLPERFAKGIRYRAFVNPGKFAVVASDALTPNGVSTLTFAPMTVHRLRSIAGRVLDTDGRPVVGATVLNWGNPAPVTSAVTGTTGRFHLDSLPRESAAFRSRESLPGPLRGFAHAGTRRSAGNGSARRDHSRPQRRREG